jgi:hypothetical protein
MGNRRYTLVLPDALFDEVQKQADRDGVAAVDLFRQFIRLGIYIRDVNRLGGKIIIRENGVEKEIALL